MKDYCHKLVSSKIKYLVCAPIGFVLKTLADKYELTSMKVKKNINAGYVVEAHDEIEFSFMLNPIETSG